MVDQEIVCCMCGDIGFADKLFQCSSCRFRFQHMYCSSYNYGNQDISSSTSMMKSMEICDWCQSEGRNSSSTLSTNKSFKRTSSSSSMDHHHHRNNNNLHIRKEDHHIITNHNNNNNDNNENTTSVVPSPRGSSSKNNSNNSGVPSPRTGVHRRYKLLKDVMC